MMPAHVPFPLLTRPIKTLLRYRLILWYTESSYCQRTLYRYTRWKHKASWISSYWRIYGAWILQNDYRKRLQEIHAWAFYGYSSGITPWNYDMYRNDSIQGSSWIHFQKAFPYDFCNVYHCCYRTVNIGFYSVQHSNSC